ncbi:uncharacterized protein LOC144823247 [Lissotriton helveticus]
MRPKEGAVPQTNKLDKYAVPLTQSQMGATSCDQSGQAEPSLTSIMAAIQTLGTNLESKMDKISIEMNLPHTDLGKTTERSKANATDIQELKALEKKLESRINDLVHQHRQMALRLEDQEGRARRSNIRVVGVPEETEGHSVELFLENLIINHLKPKRLSKIFTIERAHRAPVPKPGAPPRTIIAKILNYRDRDAILQVARQWGDLPFEGATIRFFPDFTLQVQQERRLFLGVKAALRDRGIKYMMFFPAKLKIIMGGKSHFFTSPAAVQEWFNSTAHQELQGRGGWRENRALSPGSAAEHSEGEARSQKSWRSRSTSPRGDPPRDAAVR